MDDEPTGGPDVSSGQPVEERHVLPPEQQPPIGLGDKPKGEPAKK